MTRVGWVYYNQTNDGSLTQVTDSGRKSIDIDYCVSSNIPKPFTSTGALGSRRIISSGSSNKIPFDGSGSYALSATIIVPFDIDATGCFYVLKNNSSSDWELQEITKTHPSDSSSFINNNATEYCVKNGDQWSDRVFLANSSNGSFILRKQEISIFPSDADFIDGSTGSLGGYTFNQILSGKETSLYLNSSSMNLSLSQPISASTKAVGEKFAIKVMGGVPEIPITITTTSSSFENLDGIVRSQFVVTASTGTRLEWSLYRDNVWRIRNYYVSSSIARTSQKYVQVLGSNLVALWHASEGIVTSSGDIVSWTDAIGGKVSSPDGTGTPPTYGSDSTFFKSKNVVKFGYAQQFMTASTPSLIAAGGRPYIFACFRFRTTNGFYPYIVHIPSDIQVDYTAGTGGTFAAQFITSAGTAAVNTGITIDTSQHIHQFWLDGIKANLIQDSTLYQANSTGVLTAAVNEIDFSRGGAGTGGDLSLFVVGVCTSVPTALQRSALATLLAQEAT
jgi:hypothetical protein